MGIRAVAIAWECEVVCDGYHPRDQAMEIREQAVMRIHGDDRDMAKQAAIKAGWRINGCGIACCPACTRAWAAARAEKARLAQEAKETARRERAEAKLGKAGLFGQPKKEA